MKKQFVTFYSPGTFVSEETVKEIDSWDVAKAQKMAESISERHNAIPYGFKFHTKERGPKDLDSHITLRSPMYFINCKIETRKEIDKRNDPKEKILRSNMRANKIDRVAVTIKGWKSTHPIGDNDVVLS